MRRYLAEFHFCYNNRSALGIADKERTTKAVIGANGKRLTYRRLTKPLDTKNRRLF